MGSADRDRVKFTNAGMVRVFGDDIMGVMRGGVKWGGDKIPSPYIVRDVVCSSRGRRARHRPLRPRVLPEPGRRSWSVRKALLQYVCQNRRDRPFKTFYGLLAMIRVLLNFTSCS